MGNEGLEKKLTFVNRVHLVAFLLICGLALPFASLRVSLGAIVGAGIVMLNFFALSFILRRLFRPEGKLAMLYLGVYLLKVALLFAAVGLALAYAPINRLAFLLGTMIFLLSFGALALHTTFSRG